MNNKENINFTNQENYNKHITTSELEDFLQDRLSPIALESLLEHISSCDYCANLLARSMEKKLVPAPVDMKINILNKSKPFNLQINKRKKKSKQMQLFKYSFQVITASLCAIILIFSTNKMPDTTYSDRNISRKNTLDAFQSPLITTSIQTKMDHFTYEISEFSYKIINPEVNKNDQKEK